jgi:hypothetical protein
MSKISHSLEMNKYFKSLFVDDIIIILLPFPYDDDDDDDDVDDDDN